MNRIKYLDFLSDMGGDFLDRIELEPCDYKNINLDKLIRIARKLDKKIITGVRMIFYRKDLEILEKLGVYKIQCMMGNTWSYTLFLNKEDYEKFLNEENKRILKTYLPLSSNNEIAP